MYKSIRIREDIYDELKKLANFRGVTLQELLVQMLEDITEDEKDEIRK